ncbi:hypothetical protein GFS31_27850 [Leptolyngbya sp. BL0902]|nr:hypothetical protein GFS31_27850 [Leptolyngbya sp. BL0902]
MADLGDFWATMVNAFLARCPDGSSQGAQYLSRRARFYV